MVEGARLESEYTSKAYRGFESLPLRHFLLEYKHNFAETGSSPNESPNGEGRLAQSLFDRCAGGADEIEQHIFPRLALPQL